LFGRGLGVGRITSFIETGSGGKECMKELLIFILGGMLGGFVGVAAMCLCVISGKSGAEDETVY
jgi:hypothetical protein